MELVSKKFNTHEYYTYVHIRYEEILKELALYDPNIYTISLDIDETILCDLSELPRDFINFYNLSNLNDEEILYTRPKIPYSIYFVNKIIEMGFSIYIISAREIHRYEKTISDLKEFPYKELHLYDPKLWIDVPTFKKEKRLYYNCIGIGDQFHDVDNSKFLITNPFY